jgi:prepilin-type N-terminal cleavage/methylation domain-containing protein
MTRGFTLFEIAVAVLVVAVAFSLLSTSYLNVVRSNIEANRALTALINLNLSLERLWRELKYGSEFNLVLANSVLDFKDRNCSPQKISLDISNKTIKFGDIQLTDPAVVEVTDLRFNLGGYDNTNPSYLKAAPKIITISLTARVKEFPLKTFAYQFSVAPINSVFLVSPCQQ